MNRASPADDNLPDRPEAAVPIVRRKAQAAAIPTAAEGEEPRNCLAVAAVVGARHREDVAAVVAAVEAVWEHARPSCEREAKEEASEESVEPRKEHSARA